VKREKKLIAYSAIALMIGVASIVPLVFLMSAKAELPPEEQPQFSGQLQRNEQNNLVMGVGRKP
jgi:hypothetical protein